MAVVVEQRSLTKFGVEEGEVAQIGGVLWQSEEPSRQPVPHQSTATVVLQNTVLDDLKEDVQKEFGNLTWLIEAFYCVICVCLG